MSRSRIADCFLESGTLGSAEAAAPAIYPLGINPVLGGEHAHRLARATERAEHLARIPLRPARQNKPLFWGPCELPVGERGASFGCKVSSERRAEELRTSVRGTCRVRRAELRGRKVRSNLRGGPSDMGLYAKSSLW